MTGEFVREERYIVFKVSDVEKYLTDKDRANITMMKMEIDAGRDCANKPPFKGLIVEADWPEYEPTWKAIEARVTGAQPAPIEMSITTGALSEMFLSLDGHDKAQPGYEWRKGWNDAIRQAMDYAQPAPSVPEFCPCCGNIMRACMCCPNEDCNAVTVTAEQAKYNKQHAFARKVSGAAAPEAKP